MSSGEFIPLQAFPKDNTSLGSKKLGHSLDVSTLKVSKQQSGISSSLIKGR